MSKFFLYNGVKLPALPEWDRNRYPYAFIYIVTLDGTTGVYTLVVSGSSVMGYDGNGIICPAATVGQRYTVSEDSWAAAADSDDFYIKRDNLIYTVWANFDVLNSDGSVYVAASDPVPVAEKFPLREWVGWLIASLCSRPLPLGAREPVAYLYNGVRLPGLPEKWNPKTHPCVLIVHYGITNATTTVLYFMAQVSDRDVTVSEYTGENIAEYIYYNPGDIQYTVNHKKGETFTSWGDPTVLDERKMFGIKSVVWTNTDLVLQFDSNTGVTDELYLSASDPIPVYE